MRLDDKVWSYTRKEPLFAVIIETFGNNINDYVSLVRDIVVDAINQNQQTSQFANRQLDSFSSDDLLVFQPRAGTIVVNGFEKYNITSSMAENWFAADFSKNIIRQLGLERKACEFQLCFGVEEDYNLRDDIIWLYSRVAERMQTTKLLRRTYLGTTLHNIEFYIHVPCMGGKLYYAGDFDTFTNAGKLTFWTTDYYVSGMRRRLWFEFNSNTALRYRPTTPQWFNDKAFSTFWPFGVYMNIEAATGYANDKFDLLEKAFTLFTAAKTHNTGSVWTAEYTYEAIDDDEIGFTEGDTLVVSRFVYDGWASATNVTLTASSFGRTGLIPSNYLKYISVLEANRSYDAANADEVSFEETDRLIVRSLDDSAGLATITNETTNQSGQVPLTVFYAMTPMAWIAKKAYAAVSDDEVSFAEGDMIYINAFDWENMTANATVLRTDNTGKVFLSHLEPFSQMWKSVRSNLHPPASFTDLAWKPVGDGVTFGHAVIPFNAHNIKPSGVQVDPNGRIRDCGETDAISLEPFRPGDHIINPNGTTECYTATNAWRWMHNSDEEAQGSTDPLTRKEWGKGWK